MAGEERGPEPSGQGRPLETSNALLDRYPLVDVFARQGPVDEEQASPDVVAFEHRVFLEDHLRRITRGQHAGDVLCGDAEIANDRLPSEYSRANRDPGHRFRICCHSFLWSSFARWRDLAASKTPTLRIARFRERGASPGRVLHRLRGDGEFNA